MVEVPFLRGVATSLSEMERHFMQKLVTGWDWNDIPLSEGGGHFLKYMVKI